MSRMGVKTIILGGHGKPQPLGPPKYAIVHVPTGVVTSRFATLEDAQKSHRKLHGIEGVNPDDYVVVPIDHELVQRYYEVTNRGRRKFGKEPLNPARW
jgi:hypothetical protein